jgi:hypothetical protein
VLAGVGCSSGSRTALNGRPLLLAARATGQGPARAGRQAMAAATLAMLPAVITAEARMAAVFGWFSPGARRSRCVAAFPADVPGGDQQMTLA